MNYHHSTYREFHLNIHICGISDSNNQHERMYGHQESQTHLEAGIIRLLTYSWASPIGIGPPMQSLYSVLNLEIPVW